MKGLVFCGLVLFLIASPLCCLHAGDGNKVLTLKETIDIALEKNLSIHSAREAIEGAIRKKNAAFAEFFPKLSTQYSYTRLDEQPKTRTGGNPAIPVYNLTGTTQIGWLPATPSREVKTGEREYWSLQGKITQPIFYGGYLLNNYRLSKTDWALSEAEFLKIKQDLILKVVEAYFGILKAIEISKVADQAVEQLEKHLEVAREFFNVGIIPLNDVLKVEVELADARQKKTTAQNNLELAKSNLNTLLRRHINEDIEIENILTYAPVFIELDHAIDEALKKRIELREMELTIDRAEKQIRLLESDYFPKLSLNYTYYKTEGRSTLTQEEGWYIMAVADWNFWEWGKTRQGVLAGKSNLRKAILERDQLKDQIVLEVKTAYLKLREAEKNILVAQKAVEQAKENFRMNEERYREQVGTVTDVLDARTLLTQAQTNYYNAISEYNVEKARLRKAMGVQIYE
jgi:outer membrane protein